jgi:hypothetical protein
MPTVRQLEDVMQRRSGAARLAAIALAAVAGAAACKDSGLPDRNLPVEEARQREFRYPAYQPAADPAPVAAAGRMWIRSLPVETIPSHLLEPVADAQPVQLYALRGTGAPYARLYAPAGDGRWTPYLRLN